MYWMLLTLGRRRVAATFGGIVWMLLGYHAVWFSTQILMGASVFGPIALLCIVRGLQRKDPTYAAFAGLSMGMVILGSHPQYALYLFLFLLVWLLVEARKAPGFIAIFALLSVGFGLVEIMARLDVISNGYRNPAEDFEMLYDKPWNLLSYGLTMLVGKAWFSE